MRLLFLASLLCFPCLASGVARTAIYTIHVGVNASPAGTDLQPLKYADDDAVRFYRFTQPFAARTLLFSVLDQDSQRRHRGYARVSRPPLKRTIAKALTDLKGKLLADRRAGRRTVVYFSYSGHGVKATLETKLTLLDGTVGRGWFEKHLMTLPADFIHIFLDACHAEGVVMSRGVVKQVRHARSRKLSRKERRWFFHDDALQRHANVGALLASTGTQETHEWSRLESGVFTHEVLSALAGAADVNGDGEIAYSELAAFISAANRGVTDRKAAPSIVSLPPKIDRTAPLLSRAWISKAAFLAGVPHSAGHFHVETEDGIRVIDAHPDRSTSLTLLVPPKKTLWLRSGEREARFSVAAGAKKHYSQLRFEPSSQRARGSVSANLAAGLFKTPYGRNYYRGWVDSTGQISVAFNVSTPDPIKRRDTVSKRPAIVCMASAIAALASTVIMSALSVDAKNDFDDTNLQGPARDAATRYERYTAVAIGSGVGTAVLAGLSWWLWPKSSTSNAGAAPALTGTSVGLTYSTSW